MQHSTCSRVFVSGSLHCSEFVCIQQVGEVVAVDGELANILTHSRFADDFTFQPPGGSCGVKPKVSVTTHGHHTSSQCFLH